MLVTDRTAVSPRGAHHIAHECRVLRRELDELTRQIDLPPEDYHELMIRLELLLHKATNPGGVKEKGNRR